MKYTSDNVRRAGAALYDFITPETQDVVFLSLLLAKKIADGGRPAATATSTAGGFLVEIPESDREKATRLRELIVRKCYEQELRRELVDRLVLIVARGWATTKELENAIISAKKKRAVWEATDGAKGREFMWQTLAKWGKGVFAREGVTWTQTDAALEPPPRTSDFGGDVKKEDDDATSDADLEISIDRRGRTIVKRRGSSNDNDETTRPRASAC